MCNGSSKCGSYCENNPPRKPPLSVKPGELNEQIDRIDRAVADIRQNAQKE
jgi:hypothetical protein